jgi:hypothetical protein
MLARCLLLVAGLAAAPAIAAGHLEQMPSRPGVKLSYWMMETPDAVATVLLIPGGAGGLGLRDGIPASRNFLTRSRDLFAAAGYNVAVLGKPTDREDLDTGYRASGDHVTDLHMLIDRLRTSLGKPVWLVGTSRGSVSAAAAAVDAEPSSLAGIVLTSSVTGGRGRSVPTLALSRVRVPVLVMHHRDDACPSCNPREAPRIVAALTSAPVAKLVLVQGGGPPAGDPCEPLHWHGYIGMEREAVDAIVGWMRNPFPEKS